MYICDKITEEKEAVTVRASGRACEGTALENLGERKGGSDMITPSLKGIK